MKKILSNRVTLMVALLFAALWLGTAAQTATSRPFTTTEWINGVPYQVSNLLGDNDNAKHFIRANKQQTAQPKKHAAKEEAQMVNVNIQIVEQDDVVDYPWGVVAYNEDGYKDEWGSALVYELSTGINQMRSGTYTFKATFTKLDAERNLIYYYVFKESVPVTEGMTLTFDADDAKNHIEAKIVDSDGNELQLRKFRLDANGNGYISDGLQLIMSGFMPFIKDGLGSIGGNVNGDIWNSYNFYISDIDNITVDHSIYFVRNDIIHTVSFCQKGIHDDVVFTNDPNDFVEYEAEYKVTPLGVASESAHYPCIWNAFTGASFGTEIYNYDTTDGKIKYRFGKSNFDPNYPIRVVTGFCDYERVRDWGDGEIDIWPVYTYSLPILNIDGELEFMNGGSNSCNPSSPKTYDIDGESNTVWQCQYPGHPAFSYPLSQKGPEALANNCPIARQLNSVYYNPEMGMNMMMHNINYVGRFGEVRQSDIELVEQPFWQDGSPAEGTYEFTLNNENVDVDGLPGKNVTQFWVDKSTGDILAPTLTMLHFRNAEEMVTDRFELSGNGIIELSAIDENGGIYNEEDGHYHFAVDKNINVEVAYSPYGEDNWSDIAVEENPSLFYLPDMGNFFRGSLEGVTGQAYEGWFDLKVKVTDAAGNWQEQVISPAFRIDDLAYSSVATVGKDNACEVARYNLAGQRVDASHRGVTIVRMSDGTARKVIN